MWTERPYSLHAKSWGQGAGLCRPQTRIKQGPPLLVSPSRSSRTPEKGVEAKPGFCPSSPEAHPVATPASVTSMYSVF